MRRIVLAAAVLVLLVCVVYVVYFSASKFRVEDQSYLASLSDFTFMVSVHGSRALGLSTPELTDRRYERVMSHAKKSAHDEVTDAVHFALARWGEAVAPRLENEIRAWTSEGRVRAAATVLARLESPAALEALERAIVSSNRWLVVEVIDVLHPLGRRAAPALVDAYRAYENDPPPPYNLLDAIGRAGGVELLLEEAEQASTDERILELQWPLAFTDDPRAARALFALLHHPSGEIRMRSRDAMSQSMGKAAVDPALDFLEAETDDYLRSWVIQNILASRRAASSPRAIAYLEPLVNHPVLSWEANLALARIATEPAIDILREEARRKPARWVLDHLEYGGEAGFRLIEDYTRHEDPRVRRQALWKLEELQSVEAVPIFRAALSDPDPSIRREAQRLSFDGDRLLLGESLRVWLSKLAGEEMGPVLPPTRTATSTALRVLVVMHWLGLGVSVLVGLLLLTGALRAFEPYKLALVLQFLLVVGILGDFLLMPGPSTYRWATTVRLVLLLGLLFLRDDPLPGETRGRVERLTVRSLWVLVPSFVVFGVPTIADSLRTALTDFELVKWILLELFVLTILLLEQAVLPWHMFPRGSRTERAMTLVLSAGVVAVFAVALWRNPTSGDRAALNALLTLPLVIALLFHVKTSRLFGELGRAPRLAPPPGRIRVVRDRESVIVRLKRRRSFRGVPQVLLGVAALWWIAARLEVARGGAVAMLFLIFIAIFGTVLAWLLVAIVKPSFTIQVREGAARSGNSFLGGVLGRAPWYRRVRLPAFVGQLELTPTEKRWLARVLEPA